MRPSSRIWPAVVPKRPFQYPWSSASIEFQFWVAKSKQKPVDEPTNRYLQGL